MSCLIPRAYLFVLIMAMADVAFICLTLIAHMLMLQEKVALELFLVFFGLISGFNLFQLLLMIGLLCAVGVPSRKSLWRRAKIMGALIAISAIASVVALIVDWRILNTNGIVGQIRLPIILGLEALIGMPQIALTWLLWAYDRAFPWVKD